jgi:hypothetical protein
MKTIKKVTFMGEECEVEFKSYTNGRTAIQLWSFAEGFPESMGTATVNIDSYPLKDKEVLIKDWAENSGILKALINGGIIRDTGKFVSTGYVQANVCELV